MFPQIWTNLGGNSSYKPPGASYAAPGPQQQPEFFKQPPFKNYNKMKTAMYSFTLPLKGLYSPF